MTTTQRTYDLDASALKARLRGELIQPNDEGSVSFLLAAAQFLWLGQR